MRWVRLVAISCLLVASAAAALGASGSSPPHQPAAKPALATCFWEGPISTRRPSTRGFDGRTFNFPEESATYWLARLNLPAGSRLELRGRYPHGRYMSLNAYSDGNPTDALSDITIVPRPGSTNPYLVGERREARKRGYSVSVLDEPPPSDPASRSANTLYAQPAADAPIELAYRVYEPDPGLGLSGGTALPKPVLVLEDGSVVRADAACERVNDPNREITIQTVPAAVWQGARNSPGCDGETNPAYDPIRWERFFNIDYASLSVISDCTEAGRDGRLAMERRSRRRLLLEPRQRLHLRPPRARVRPGRDARGPAAEVPADLHRA